ncbi:MAG: GAF domain-containing protein, partial [Candidatus Sulfotelmatobacter sp.]
MDQSSPQPGAEPELEAAELESELELELEHKVAHGGVGRLNPGVASPSVSAGIAAANALAAAGAAGEAGWHVGPRFPGEDGGHSMAEMAQRDLDAALQLLADRAQYITGAGGAAIALRRDERNEMLCRASSGAKAPQLGALLSTESGLSGESVRTRMPLRCDDAEHDPRVNQESCRDLGIASVMIVPIMGEDRLGQGQVLGVFELFSGQADAFAERDLSALQRLGEMVETAVKLARAAEGAPPEMVAPDMAIDAADLNLPGQVPSDIMTEIATEVTVVPRGTAGVLESAGFADEGPVLEVEMDEPAAELPREVAVAEAGVETAVTAAPAVELAVPLVPPQAVPADIPAVVAATPAAIPPVVVAVSVVPAKEQPAKRPLMWSAAAVPASPDTPKPVEADQSHVPPMLRGLRKCKACGFPVSEGRTLCVECDEKQWRGQPLPAAAGKARGAGPAVDFRQGGAAGSGSSGIQPKAASGAGQIPVAAVRASISASVVPDSASGSSSAKSSNPVVIPASAASVLRVAPQNLAAALAELNEQEKRVEAARRGEAIAVPAAALAKVVEPEPRGAAAASVPIAIALPVPVSVSSGEILTQVAAKPAEVAEAKAAVEPVREIPQNPASLD